MSFMNSLVVTQYNLSLSTFRPCNQKKADPISCSRFPNNQFFSHFFLNYPHFFGKSIVTLTFWFVYFDSPLKIIKIRSKTRTAVLVNKMVVSEFRIGCWNVVSKIMVSTRWSNVKTPYTSLLLMSHTGGGHHWVTVYRILNWRTSNKRSFNESRWLRMTWDKNKWLKVT